MFNYNQFQQGNQYNKQPMNNDKFFQGQNPYQQKQNRNQYQQQQPSRYQQKQPNRYQQQDPDSINRQKAQLFGQQQQQQPQRQYKQPQRSDQNPRYQNQQKQQKQQNLKNQAELGMNIFSQALKQSSRDNEYQQLTQQYQGTNKMFVDPEFPANKYSLSENKYSNWPSNLAWFRPSEFWKGQSYHLFTEGIEPGDIKQGIIGDCYFLCALASIAEIPDRIYKCFSQKNTSKNGMYGIKMYEMGEEVIKVVDDQFPCFSKQRGLCFSRGNGKEIWVPVMEKAWAKTYGSYIQIQAGFTREALRAFTGAPAKTFQMTDEEGWGELMKGEKMNWVMTAGTDTTKGTQNQAQQNGLVAGHAYSLLSVHEVFANGQKVKLVKLRNPWGTGEWQGQWSDDSYTWTPELKQQLNVQNIDDGVFYMSWADFRAHLADYQICYVNDNYRYSHYRSKCSFGELMYFKMTVPTQGQYYISISQTSARKFRESENYKYSEVRLVIAKNNGNGTYTYMESISDAKQDVWKDCKRLTPGNYVVHVSVDWYQKNTRNFVISSYGAGKVEFSPLPKLQGFLKSVFKDRGRNIDQSQRKSLANKGLPNSYKVMNFDDAYSYYYVNNLQGSSGLDCTINFSKMEGIKYMEFQGSKAKVSVDARGEGIILMTKESSFAISYSEQIQIKRGVNDLIAKCKSEGGEKQWKQGNELVVRQYSLQHDFGMFYYYENVSRSKTLDMNITYKLTNLKVVPEGGNKVNVKVGPGQSQTVNLVKTDAMWNLGMSMSYSIY